MNSLAGRTAVITGSASGLGAAMATRFVAEGAQVVATDIDRSGGEAIARELGEACTFVEHDVADEVAWQKVIAAALDLGGFDMLVNNAGITIMGSIETLSLADWQKTMDVDLTGVFLGCKYGVAAMKENGGGSIVNISSAAGLRASADLAAYNSAKAAVTMLTQSVAVHCGRAGYGIRCNSVHPGVIRTPILDKVMAQVEDGEAMMNGFVAQHPIGHIGETDDIVNIVLYLMSAEAKFATGAPFIVDGGLSL